ncbi:MAG: hypothetical protein MK136_12205 [Pirellulaceae bacterium]|nr:hypothetical protein [Pirellulaceae bacterium]MDP7377088.1 hypothetical protein [Pirellulaceae bacterium]
MWMFPGCAGSDLDRLAPLGREPGNLLVMRRNMRDGTLRPTGASWEAPHVISVQVARRQANRDPHNSARHRLTLTSAT